MTWLEVGAIALSVLLLIQSAILMWVVSRLVTLGFVLKATLTANSTTDGGA